MSYVHERPIGKLNRNERFDLFDELQSNLTQNLLKIQQRSISDARKQKLISKEVGRFKQETAPLREELGLSI